MLKPLGDRVVIELVQAEEKTASGIVLPETAKEKPQEGKVIAVGTGRVLENGERVALEVAAGDLIIFSKYAGTEVKYEGTDYLIMLCLKRYKILCNWECVCKCRSAHGSY